MNYFDRQLRCTECGEDFVFTAGEQLFFFDKQFKNDPKRCKLCKAKRSVASRSEGAVGVIVLPLSRTETRTECSACGVGTTVPFRPTQGRPVLCRACFGRKRVAAAATAALYTPSGHILADAQALQNSLTASTVANTATCVGPLLVPSGQGASIPAQLLSYERDDTGRGSPSEALPN